MTANDLDRMLDAVMTRKDLAAFIKALRTDFISRPDRWENQSVPHFLDGLSRVLIDNSPESFQVVRGDDAGQPTWQNIAQLLISASAYE